MAAQIVFGGGETLEVPSTDAHGLMLNLGRAARGERIQTATGPIPLGFVDVETPDGIVYVNPVQVAYVRDV